MFDYAVPIQTSSIRKWVVLVTPCTPLPIMSLSKNSSVLMSPGSLLTRMATFLNAFTKKYCLEGGPVLMSGPGPWPPAPLLNRHWLVFLLPLEPSSTELLKMSMTTWDLSSERISCVSQLISGDHLMTLLQVFKVQWGLAVTGQPAKLSRFYIEPLCVVEEKVHVHMSLSWPHVLTDIKWSFA